MLRLIFFHWFTTEAKYDPPKNSAPGPPRLITLLKSDLTVASIFRFIKVGRICMNLEQNMSFLMEFNGFTRITVLFRTFSSKFYNSRRIFPCIIVFFNTFSHKCSNFIEFRPTLFFLPCSSVNDAPVVSCERNESTSGAASTVS